MESVPLLWHLPPVLNKSGVAFFFLSHYTTFRPPLLALKCFFPKQRKLMGPSAQNSSGVHWCRRRARFNEVPEKVPEKVWQAKSGSTGFRRRFRWRSGRKQGSGEGFREALVQSQGRFNRVPEKVLEKVWEALVQSQVKFNKVPEKVGEAWCRARSCSTGFRRRFRRRSGSGRLRCRARSNSTGFWRRFRWRSGRKQGSGEGFREALVQSQVRFNRVPEKVPGVGGFGAEPGQVQQDLRPLNWRKPSWGVSSAWFRSTLQKDCKNKTLRLLGIPPKLILRATYCIKPVTIWFRDLCFARKVLRMLPWWWNGAWWCWMPDPKFPFVLWSPLIPCGVATFEKGGPVLSTIVYRFESYRWGIAAPQN